jgi:hypothetical protein
MLYPYAQEEPRLLAGIGCVIPDRSMTAGPLPQRIRHIQRITRDGIYLDFYFLRKGAVSGFWHQAADPACPLHVRFEGVKRTRYTRSETFRV